jgi:hypothetical protein
MAESTNCNRGLIATCLIMTSLGCSQAAGGQDLPKVSNFLDSLETAIKSITSFDVYVQDTTEYYFSTEKDESGRQARAVTLHSPPIIERTKSRQMFAYNGWRRIEGRDSDTGKDGGVIVGADNEVERIHFPLRSEGAVRAAGGPSMSDGSDYFETFRTVTTSIPILVVFREREKEARIRREPSGRVVLEVDPTDVRGMTYGGWGFRVYADPAVNLLPAVIEKYWIIKGKQVLLSRRTILERKQIAPGVAVPVKSVTHYFEPEKDSGKFGEVWKKVDLVVDVARSRWNHPIPQEAFRVPFPAGTRVIDEIRDVAFVTGKPDPGRNLADLAANARGLIRNVQYRPLPPPSYAWVWWAAAGSAAALALTGFALYRRRAGRRAA